jgi:predicted NUDIX family phosphoesterase
MSHREHILAFKALPLSLIMLPDDPNTPAFNPMGYTPRTDHIDQILFKNFHHATEVIWRDTAEYWPEGVDPTSYTPDHRQILPYALLTRTVDGEKQYSVYQRVKGIGEERLLKGHSIGWGGHLAGKGVQYDDDEGILVWESILAGLKAEMGQECGVDTEAEGVVTTLHGYIHSFASPVDALHLSVVLEVEIPADYVVSVTEKGLDFKGWYNIEQLKSLWTELKSTDVKFESWSNFIIEKLA